MTIESELRELSIVHKGGTLFFIRRKTVKSVREKQCPEHERTGVSL